MRLKTFVFFLFLVGFLFVISASHLHAITSFYPPRADVLSYLFDNSSNPQVLTFTGLAVGGTKVVTCTVGGANGQQTFPYPIASAGYDIPGTSLSGYPGLSLIQFGAEGDCVGSGDGGAVLYVYDFDPPTNVNVSGLSAGDYTLTVTVSGFGGSSSKSVNFTINRAALPVNCVGSWSDTSTCSVSCGGGVKQQVYTITTPAANGGTQCPYSNGATQWGSTSCNTQPCVVPVNGSCSATHYDCSSGSSVNHGADSTQWTWNCNGSNGGTTASCSESKGSAVSPSGALSATSCEIAAGSSTCNSFVTWGTQNLTSGTTEVTKNNPANTHVSFATSGNNALNTIRYGVTGISTFFLYHNIDGTPIILAQDSVTASCSAGSIWDGSICKAIPEGMSGTLTPASPSCDIALSKSSCIINFSWNTINPVDTSKVTRNPANTIVATGNSGTNVPFTVKYDIETFFLYNNTVNLATSTVTSSCVSGTEWNGVRCIAGVSAIDGVCSATHYNCLPGISVDKVNGLNSWTWYCNGLNGGNRSPQCSESKNPGAIDGVCSVTHYNCSEGISNNNISGLNSWTWTCDGSGGGTNAACFEKYRIPTFIED